MKKIIITTLILLIFSTISIQAQTLSQTIRGTVIDADSKVPLVGVVVRIVDSNQNKGARTNADGDFEIKDVSIGRISLNLSYIGYENKLIPNVEVNSGKQAILNINMRESKRKIKAVKIKARKSGELRNDMVLISGNSITVAETQRFAGSFNDPSRMVTSMAGVSGLGSEYDNDIIIRGNSPKFVQWRLEGIEIPSPNHFAQLGGSGGAISALNSDLLATSDFYTGAFSAEYGNVLSGVMDMKLRKGNNKKREYAIGVGLLGSDATFEGPFKQGYRGSYLVNVRYSTLAPAQALGIFDATDGIPKYRDAAFKLFLPTKKFGTFSLWGLNGNSSLIEEGVDSVNFNINATDKIVGTEDWRENYTTGFYTGGINHFLPLSKKVYLETILSYSNNRVLADETLKIQGKVEDSIGTVLKDTLKDTYKDFYNKTTQNNLRISTKLNAKINASHKIEIGTKYIQSNNQINEYYFDDDDQKNVTNIDFNKSIGSMRSFVNWKYRITEDLTMVAGVHHFFVKLNNEHSVEPRLALKYKLSPKSSLSLAYGKHSTMETIPNYFAKVRDNNGNITEPNKNLGLLKAHHYVIGYNHRLAKNVNAKVEVYYQDLYNIPVHNDSNSFVSTINEVNDFQNIDLVNAGTARNYGIEMTVEKFFSNNYYYMGNASFYSSTYKSLENKERNTTFNGGFSLNALFGKEFTQLSKKKNKTVAINLRANYTGAKRIIPLIKDANGNVIVFPNEGVGRDVSKAYENGLDNLFQMNFSASYKVNRPSATHEFSLDIINVLNNKAKVYEFYNPRAANGVGYVQQLSLLPNILYRVHF